MLMDLKGTGRVKPLRKLLRIPLLRLYEKWFSGGDPLL
jgi:hypothetical protein